MRVHSTSLQMRGDIKEELIHGYTESSLLLMGEKGKNDNKHSSH